jgi:hypothetical protein
MRKLRLVLALAVASLAGGCAAGGGTYWPAGTQAVVSPPKSQRMLARVPTDQKAGAGGRNWVAIASGTRVVCLADLDYDRVNPGRSNPSPTADIRVRVIEGPDNGLELFIPRQALAVPPEPIPPGMVVVLSLPAIAILALAVSRLIAAAAEASSRRREVLRHGIESHAGERIPTRTRRHRTEHVLPSAHVDDQSEWAKWLASRNSLSRDRMPVPASCRGKP